MYQHYEFLKVTRDGARLNISMNNPPLNAAAYGLHDELSHVFYDVARDDCSVVVLTGEGRAFSAGGDLDDMLRNATEPARQADMMKRAPHIVHGLLALDIPVIARVNGHAMGLGATLALLCDVAIMNEGARIADPHVQVGLSAGDGGAMLWPLLIGFARARHHLLTGEALTGEQAAQIGLIHKAVPADQLDAEVDAYVDRLLALPQLALRYTKRSINMVLRAQTALLTEAHAGLEQLTMSSADHVEAIMAFKDKRPGNYVGK